MRYWWVNQNQTFEQESSGNYLWSPKRKAGNQRNPFYEFMREVAPGDIVFSFARTRIPAIGVVLDHAYESPKPLEFAGAGSNWSDIGWKVPVRYHFVRNLIRPADHMGMLGPLLPATYAPLQRNGRGLQGVYLTTLSEPLASALVSLIGAEARSLIDAVRPSVSLPDTAPDVLADTIEWENHIADQLAIDPTIPNTEKSAVIMARRGQGRFKKNVRHHESECRVTGVRRISHLIASHIKPWRDCDSNEERLNGENGLLLTPSIDHLFDRGYISFENNGELLVSPVADRESVVKMGIPLNRAFNSGDFSTNQKTFLDFHRERVFLQARLG